MQCKKKEEYRKEKVMKIANYIKNAMISALIVVIYAMWSVKELHEVGTVTLWIILISVFLVAYNILCILDKEIRRIQKERKKKSKCKRTHSNRE